MNAQFDLFASIPLSAPLPVLSDPPGTWDSKVVCWHDVRQSLEWLEQLPPAPDYVPAFIHSLVTRYIAAYRLVATHPAVHVEPPRFDSATIDTLINYLRNTLPTNHALHAESTAFHSRMLAGPPMGNTGIKTTWPEPNYEAGGVTFPGYLAIICRRWSYDNGHIEISDAQDDFFFASYKDTTTVSLIDTVDVSRCYACQKIAEARTVPANVNVFYANGQPYLLDGWHNHTTKFNEINAYPVSGYQLIHRTDWPYQTHSYAELIAMWDDGSRERGDKRGLVVRVNSDVAVAAKLVRFYALDIGRVSANDEDQTDGLDDEDINSNHDDLDDLDDTP